MSEELKYQLRLTLSDPFAKLVGRFNQFERIG